MPAPNDAERLAEHRRTVGGAGDQPGVITLVDRDDEMAHLLVVGQHHAELKVALWPEAIRRHLDELSRQEGEA